MILTNVNILTDTEGAADEKVSEVHRFILSLVGSAICSNMTCPHCGD